MCTVIPHLMERVLRVQFTIARHLVRKLGRIVADARHLLAHLSYSSELFLQERLGHDSTPALLTANVVPKDTEALIGSFMTLWMPSPERMECLEQPLAYYIRISAPLAGRPVACAIAAA